MKKRFLVMAMAGVALAGCVNNDVEEITQKQNPSKIMFSAPVMYDNAETRRVSGEILANNYPTTEKFVVFAKKYTGTYSNWGAGQIIWGTADAPYKVVAFNPDLNGWEPWGGTVSENVTDANKEKFESYYWNTEMKAAFAAYSPAELNPYASVSFNDNGFVISNFQVESQPVNQYDLMYTDLSTDITTSNQTWAGYSGTPLVFHHALSSIRFAIVGDEEAVLTGLKVCNVAQKGTFTQNLSQKWDVNETELGTFTIYNGINVNFTESPQFILDLLKKDNPDYSAAKNFLMIPQTFTNSTGGFDKSKDPYIEVNYTDKNSVDQISVIPLADYFSGEWLIGTRHIYILSLGGSSKIFFAPGVDTWTELEHDEVIQLDNYHN